MRISNLAKTMLVAFPLLSMSIASAQTQTEPASLDAASFETAAPQDLDILAEPTDLVTAPQDEQEEAFVRVNDAVAGWNGADPSAPMNLSQDLRSNWVMLNSEGNLPGRVVANGNVLAEAKVFLIQNGMLKAETVSNKDGQFIVRGLSQGSYSVVVHGEGMYAISGLIVLDSDDQTGPFQRDLTVSVSEESTLQIFRLVTHHATSVHFREFGQHTFGETANDPARLLGIQGLTSLKPAALPASTIGRYRVSMSSDGGLVGRVHVAQAATGRPVDLKSSEVIILQNGEVVHQTQTNRYGVFHISGLEAGYYSLVSAGQDGLLVTGFELVGSSAPSAQTVSNSPVAQHLVTTPVQDDAVDVPPPAPAPAVEVSPGFDGMMAPREDIGWVNNYMLQNPVYEEVITEDITTNDGMPMMDGCGGCDPCGGYGGFGGDGFGGGGFGLGGGFGGGGLALPLTAAAIAAAVSRDNDPFRAPVPVSPFSN